MRRVVTLIALVSMLQMFEKLGAHTQIYPSTSMGIYPPELKRDDGFKLFYNNPNKKIVSQCLDNYLTYCNTISMMYNSATSQCISSYPDNPDASLECQLAAADVYFIMHSIGDNAYDTCMGNTPKSAPQN